jgi:hypothetical protein
MSNHDHKTVLTGVLALVNQEWDRRKTAEFPMNACWKEDAQAVASKQLLAAPKPRLSGRVGCVGKTGLICVRKPI